MTDPALNDLLRQLSLGDVLWAQVRLRADNQGFTLCHVEDAGRPTPELAMVAPDQLRAIAQFTASGAFRPIKTAPNLRRGWLCRAANPTALRDALRVLYPGSLADWHAVRAGHARPTHYHDYTARQTGMYRITARLDAAQAAKVANACCAPRFCLKQRLWKAHDADTPGATGKSGLPCLEPCALLLELARKAARIEQEEPSRAAAMKPTELEVVLVALEAAAAVPPGREREADFTSPSNPRLAALVLERLRP